jgi:ribosomal protein S18 acetylase RimI-like enzyme
MNCTSYSQINLTFEQGIPSHEFFEKAWSSEPLTKILRETNIPFALPGPDEDISLLAKYEENSVIGQCSANRVAKYWSHLENINSENQNLSTQIFVKIHKKAIEVEKKYLEQIDEPIEQSFHSAGIAVLPDYRGKRVGLAMRRKQIEVCKQHKATTLFCETTNQFSASTVEKFGFTKITEYPYSKLAEELGHSSLNELNDSFSVWCLKV